MTALDRLREIEKRRAKATAGEWDAVLESDPRGQPVPYYRGLVSLIEHSPGRRLSVVAKSGYVTAAELEANTRLIAHAPVDLAWLAAIARAVLEAPCDFPTASGDCAALARRQFHRGIPEREALTAKWFARSACTPCRIRRDAEASAR